MRTCDARHVGACHTIIDPRLRIDPPQHLIFIDVANACLVRRPGRCKYVALSYVWGKSGTPFQTTKDNLDELLRPGALDRYRMSIPDTIRDSMAFVGSIGQRYLWVDRFAIIQDDNAHTNAQLKNMAGIYFNAYFTIVAAEGSDDTYGLRGLPSSARPRLLQARSLDFSSTSSFYYVLRSHHDTGKYDERGWTFQEYELSPRKVIFRNNGVEWNCCQYLWGEFEAKPHFRGRISHTPSYGFFRIEAVLFHGYAV
ncbi:HET-domain-containing protein [Trematosphaeria pertusa]|uniref:HET-domain-containing protein n=1 Tax=Trematosphaeria pertusa TaxID=390896 RepID=A0A6A6HRJ7_9PLEO|nr:HET-domain-containing protein [Trematosphaeria pertusa]KAF2240784.1 HET-domain-containing protein [Trematosphaeria pertusa]